MFEDLKSVGELVGATIIITAGLMWGLGVGYQQAGKLIVGFIVVAFGFGLVLDVCKRYTEKEKP